MIELKIEALLAEKFSEPEYADCFVVDILYDTKAKLEVYIDSDSGITFSTCQRISRYLESYIDAEGWLGEKYILEVSSPGLDRPLKFFRQYVKNKGRTLEVTLQDGTSVKGILRSVNEEKIIIEKPAHKKKGQKKQPATEVEIPIEAIEKAYVRINF